MAAAFFVVRVGPAPAWRAPTDVRLPDVLVRRAPAPLDPAPAPAALVRELEAVSRLRPVRLVPLGAGRLEFLAPARSEDPVERRTPAARRAPPLDEELGRFEPFDEPRDERRSLMAAPDPSGARAGVRTGRTTSQYGHRSALCGMTWRRNTHHVHDCCVAAHIGGVVTTGSSRRRHPSASVHPGAGADLGRTSAPVRRDGAVTRQGRRSRAGAQITRRGRPPCGPATTRAARSRRVRRPGGRAPSADPGGSGRPHRSRGRARSPGSA